MYVCVYVWNVLWLIAMILIWTTYELIYMRSMWYLNLYDEMVKNHVWYMSPYVIKCWLCYMMKVCGHYDYDEDMNDVCSWIILWLTLSTWLCTLWLRTCKRTCIKMNMHICMNCITWDIKGLLTVYSSHCDHDTDRCYRPTVPVNPGHDRRLKGVNPGHWSTVR